MFLVKLFGIFLISFLLLFVFFIPIVKDSELTFYFLLGGISGAYPAFEYLDNILLFSKQNAHEIKKNNPITINFCFGLTSREFSPILIKRIVGTELANKIQKHLIIQFVFIFICYYLIIAAMLFIEYS